MNTWGRWLAVDSKPRHTTAMSTIWRVRDSANPGGPIFALKTLRYAKGPGTAAVKRLQREIQTLRELDHPGIVRIVDFGESDDLYYVMEWADTSLQQAAASFEGLIDSSLHVCIEVARAVVAAHGKGIVHRDIKPANILLYGDQRAPRVADFGIVYVADGERVTMTEGGTVGTEDFVAPELRGRGRMDEVKENVDVYSLGKTLYAIVSGGVILPREYLDDPTFDLTVKFTDPRMEHLKGLLGRMLADPSDRYSTMAQCCEAMERLQDNIRRGVPYSPGMYGGSAAPIEQYGRLLRRMQETGGLRRADLIQDAISSGAESASVLTQKAGQRSEVLTAVVGQPIPLALEAAQGAAAELLAVGLAILSEGRAEEVEQLVAELKSFANTPEHTHEPGHRWLLPPLAAYVTLILTGVAWYRRRYEALGILAAAQATGGGRWIHHYVLARSADRLFDWCLEGAKKSDLLQFAEHGIGSRLDECLSCGAGLVALKGLVAVPSQRLDAWMAEPGYNGSLATAYYPGFCFAASKWTSFLPAQFAKLPGQEAAVASAVFGLPHAGFLAEVKRVTPALIRTLARCAPNRDLAWPIRGHDWDKWCEPSSE